MPLTCDQTLVPFSTFTPLHLQGSRDSLCSKSCRGDSRCSAFSRLTSQHKKCLILGLMEASINFLSDKDHYGTEFSLLRMMDHGPENIF